MSTYNQVREMLATKVKSTCHSLYSLFLTFLVCLLIFGMTPVVLQRHDFGLSSKVEHCRHVTALKA